MAFAVNDDVKVRTSDITEKCNASTRHLLQVVSLLHSHGFIVTIRGRSGGLRLARAMEKISIGEVFRVFKSSTVALLRHFATVLGLMPSSLLSCASEACNRCIAALTACVVAALP